MDASFQGERPLLVLGPEYKAKSCKFFARGSCAKGALCNFAHGPREVRHPGSFFISFPSNDFDPVAFLVNAFAPYAENVGFSSVMPFVDRNYLRIATVNGQEEYGAGKILHLKSIFEGLYPQFVCSTEVKAYFVGDQSFYVTGLGFYLPPFLPYYLDENVLEQSALQHEPSPVPPVVHYSYPSTAAQSSWDHTVPCMVYNPGSSMDPRQESQSS